MMSAGVPVRKPPAFTASSMRGSFAVGARFGSRIVSICSSVSPRHQAQFAEHLHVLFVVLRRPPHAGFAAFGDEELEAERQPLADFDVLAGARIGGLELHHVGSTAPPSAEPPPITPQMPCFAMKSNARWEPLWIGCQHSTGRRSGRGTSVSSFSV